MDPASVSLSERFRMALDFCDAAGARADMTPVVSELRPRQVTFSEPLMGPPPLIPAQAMPPQWAPPRPPGAIPTALIPPAFVAGPHGPPELQAPSEPGEVATNKGGGTLKAIAIVVGVLLLAAAGWFVRRRLVEPFLARRRRAAQAAESDEEESVQMPIPPRATSSWRQQAARPTPPRKVTFVVPPEEVFVPEAPMQPQRRATQRPLSAKGRAAQQAQVQQPQPSPGKKRAALLAAQRAVAEKNAERARQLSQEEEVSDEEEGFFPAEEPVDPNFTEI